MSDVAAVHERPEDEASHGVPDRIRAEFARRAAQGGIRGVVMADLARDLRVSTKTIYRHFPTKAALVAELVEAWVDELADQQAAVLARGGHPLTTAHRVARGIWDHLQRYPARFWEDLRLDYPDEQRVLERRVQELRESALEWIHGAVRDDLNPRFVLRLMEQMVVFAGDPETLEGLGMTPEEAIQQAATIWADGAFRTATAS